MPLSPLANARKKGDGTKGRGKRSKPKAAPLPSHIGGCDEFSEQTSDDEASEETKRIQKMSDLWEQQAPSKMRKVKFPVAV